MLKGICSRCRPRPYALKQHDLGGFKTSLAKATCVIAESYIKITYELAIMKFVSSISRASWISTYQLIESVASWMCDVLETHSEKLETSLGPVERRSRDLWRQMICIVLHRIITARQ